MEFKKENIIFIHNRIFAIILPVKHTLLREIRIINFIVSRDSF